MEGLEKGKPRGSKALRGWEEEEGEDNHGGPYACRGDDGVSTTP